jgi:hypothetical protein
VDQGAIYTARLAGSAGPDPILQDIVRQHDRGAFAAPIPLCLVVDGVIVRGHLAPDEESTSYFDERYERLVRDAASRDPASRESLERHLAQWSEHDRWSVLLRKDAERLERMRLTVVEAKGEAEWDPLNAPAEVVTPWIEAASRSSCTLKNAIVWWPGSSHRVTQPTLRVALHSVGAWWFDWHNATGSAYEQAVALNNPVAAEKPTAIRQFFGGVVTLATAAAVLVALAALTIGGAWLAAKVL